MKLTDVKVGKEYACYMWNNYTPAQVTVNEVGVELERYSYPGVAITTKTGYEHNIPAKELGMLWEKHLERLDRRQKERDERTKKRKKAKAMASSIENEMEIMEIKGLVRLHHMRPGPGINITLDIENATKLYDILLEA